MESLDQTHATFWTLRKIIIVFENQEVVGTYFNFLLSIRCFGGANLVCGFVE
jgi:hypothetical protein